MSLGQEVSLGQEMSEPAGDSEPDVFEIVLPITILVLSDDDFLHNDTEEEAAASVPELKEVEEEVNSNNSVFLKKHVTPSNDSDSLSICEESKTASNKDNSMKYSEEKWVAENICNRSESSLNDQCDAGADKQSQYYVLPTSSCKTELTEINKTSDRKECGGDDGFEKIPSLVSSAGKGDGDEAMETSRQLVSAEISRHEEELVSVASVLSDGSREKQPEVQKELETVIEIEDPHSSKNGGNETNNRKRSEFEDGTWSSLLENGLKEELKFTSNCSALFLNGCSPTSEELLKDVGKLEMSTSPSAESNTTGEHINKTLTQFPQKIHQQQEVSPHESLKELQSQQEDLAWLSNSVTIKPVSKASCSTNKQERLNLKCRFCSSVYKCSAHLKKHVYSAHKDKKMHKCCFCKRTFFFFVNLKKHLKFHKKMSRLKRARKNRMNIKKIRQRKCEEEKSETKNKESKYEQFFIKIERDFSPLGMPVSFSCRICFFASSNPRSFVQHMKGHKERPPYQCPQCDYSFISFSYLLNHMYWHAGYKLYQCRFCTFFSLYFASMVRHSYMHLGGKQHSSEFCEAAFVNTVELQRHGQLHAGNETHQGQQLGFVSRRKRTRRPLKSYMCDDCNLVFYNRGHLNFHKKSHERFKVTANGYQSNKYRKSKICKVESNSQGHVSLSLSGQEDGCLSGGMLASEIDFEQEGDVQDNKEMCFGRKFPENGHGSKSLPVIGYRPDILLNPYKMETIVCKGEPLFSSEASCSQAQDDDAYHKFVENLKTTWPSNLCVFKTYKCQHCSYATAVHSDFKLHLKTHTVGRPFVCKECNKAFKTSNHLQKHSCIHVKNGFEFGHCCCVGSSLQNLELHHEMQVALCPERDFGSSEGSNSIHSLLGSEFCGLQPDVQRGKKRDLPARSQRQYYKCAECEYATYILSNLKLHVRTHTGEKPYSCSVCQKKFRTSSHLKRHSVLHFNIKFLKCENCDYSTNKWLSLKQHLASHSCRESSSTGCLHEQKKQLPFKTYTCEECGYCTAHNSNLKPHLRIHTGEKPFKCDQCPLAFRTSSHLKRHLLTHSKLLCRKCKFSTADERAFQKHVKTHAKMYKCVKCNVTLPTKKLLEKHKRQHKAGI
ncbi:zinc finger protein 99-like [Caloenas nicobarica]|uniref:zinc finger protein 99-like n=1 Tax=Caloenas nicobarica TaxID=187106 RepID=UPI0032B79BF8